MSEYKCLECGKEMITRQEINIHEIVCRKAMVVSMNVVRILKGMKA